MLIFYARLFWKGIFVLQEQKELQLPYGAQNYLSDRNA